MPIALAPADVAGLATAGRAVFVLDPTGAAAPAVVAALAAIDRVTVPARSGNVFGGGLDRILHNFLAGMPVGYGLAALTDDVTFMLAVRTLADEIYDAVRAPGGTDVIVDASLANTPLAHVIQAIYPDALFVAVDGPDGAYPAPARLVGAHVVHLTAADVANTTALTERLTAALAGARAATGPPQPPAPALTLPGAPVFVVGCPRSGTTWLQNMLVAHPGTGGPRNETAMFASVRGVLDNAALGDWIARDALVASLRRFSEHLFATCLATQSPGATRLIEKTPDHALHLDVIAALYPEASVIGIHRDGRDVVRSLLEVDSGAQSAAEAADGWVRATQAVTEFATHFRLTRDERYEALLDDPVVGTVDVLRWLDLAPDAAVVDELRARANTRVSERGTTGEVGSGKWRDMASPDLQTIYRIAGDQLVALDYMTSDELATARREPAYRAAAIAARVKAPARKTARFLRAKRPR